MIELRIIGTVESPLRDAGQAPKQGEEGSPLAELVFDASVKDASTRSADRPNPIGVHRVTVVANPGPLRFQVRNLEALDGTPIVDVKTTLEDFVE